MHILALIGVIISGLGVWYWRYKTVRNVGSEVFDAVTRAQGAYRRHNFKKKAESSVLNSVDDPALAAAIFLFALANDIGGIDHLAEAEIRVQLAPIVPAEKMDECIAYASWAARAVVDPRDCVRRFKTLWRDNLTDDESQDLIDMALKVAALARTPEPSQKLVIDTLRTALSPEGR